MAVGYDLAVSPADEERSEVMERVRAAGFDEAAVEMAGELADETVALAATTFKRSTEHYERLKTEAALHG